MSEVVPRKYVPAHIKITYYVLSGGAVTGPYVSFPANPEGKDLKLDTAAYQRMNKRTEELIKIYRDFTKQPKTKKQADEE